MKAYLKGRGDNITIENVTYYILSSFLIAHRGQKMELHVRNVQTGVVYDIVVHSYLEVD